MSQGICRLCKEKKDFENSSAQVVHHITLEKEHGYIPTKNEKNSRSWNRWLND
jgi:hypothetical protein